MIKDKPYFILGEHNLNCWVCSKKLKSREALKRWDGVYVCPECYETKHPALQKPPMIRESRPPKVLRPEGDANYTFSFTWELMPNDWEEYEEDWTYYG